MTLTVSPDRTSQERLKGERFQKIVLERCKQLSDLGLASIGEYGVQSARRVDGTVVTIQSLPDFEGVTSDGRQAIFDAKVCSQASFNLAKYRRTPEVKGPRSKQLTHMLDRSRFGVRCFFLIHWNPRLLKTRRVAPVTYAFPVSHDHPFWLAFAVGDEKSITRPHCEVHGFVVPWTLATGNDRKFRPDVLAAVDSVDQGGRSQ